MPYFYSSASLKGFQAKGVAFSLKKRASSIEIWKHEISSLFLFSWVIFAFLDPQSQTQLNADSIRIRIRIRNTAQNPLEGYI